ncbi:MAG: FAD-binding oxidoreductase, partial [Acidimicrobiales bacterium]
MAAGLSATGPASGPAATAPAPAGHHAVFHRLAVSEVRRLTDDAVAITFEVPDELAAAYRFTQGQHVALLCPVAGDEVRRNYSICESAASGVLRVAVKRLPGGVFSGYAHGRLQPGDVLDVMTPVGRFFTPLDPASRKRYAAIAAGSGITPVLSIVATTLEVEPASQVTLVYQNRTTGSIMFLEELEDLKNRYPARLELIHVLSREPQDLELFHGRLDRGRLTDLLDRLIPPEDVDEWFLCGPASMIEEARSTLLARGVPAARVHRELFHSEPGPGLRRVATHRGGGP